jgi:hypothetical protein
MNDTCEPNEERMKHVCTTTPTPSLLQGQYEVKDIQYVAFFFSNSLKTESII